MLQPSPAEERREPRLSDLQRIELFGCPLDIVDFEETAAWCRKTIQGNAPPVQLMTINAQSLLLVKDDAEVGEAVKKAGLIVGDGVSIAIATRALKLPWKGRVTGVDLTQRILADGMSYGLKVFYLGATPATVKRLVEVTAERYPGVQVVGAQDGFYDRKNDGPIIDRIRASGAQVLFVGMPTPYKEIWLQKNMERLGVRLAIGVGGTFDVMTGQVKRAPVVFQNIGMEWLWRMMMEPRKMWKRNVVYNSRFLYLLAKAKFGS
jgi:N-acetylglucosaminyldiphosphoundecaprenol N-acetyl-beta-D-mannosaminyltransferase